MRFTRQVAFALAALVLTSAPARAEPVAGTPLSREETRDALGRTIVYYRSHPGRPAPVLLLVQGSGCAPVIRTQGASSYSTLFDLLPLAADPRFTVVAVEKPSAPPDGPGGTAEGCGAAFNVDFTAERWLAALRAAIDAVERQTDVAHDRLVVLGTSEGAVMADLLAGRDRRVSEVISISGSGTTQLLDFLALAYARCFDRSPCLKAVEAQARAIRADPQSVTRFAWGHPFRRWTSFFAVDPGVELVRSRARAYLAIGGEDQSVPALSQEVAVAKLLAAGRDVTVQRVVEGDHALAGAGGGLDALDAEMRRALDWALAP